jgi:hypothetical protein
VLCCDLGTSTCYSPGSGSCQTTGSDDGGGGGDDGGGGGMGGI